MEQTSGNTQQYLTFRLARELFAFNVLHIKEVLELVKITRIPKTPSFMTGVINLRGGVVPVVDLREKFEMGAAERTVDTSIIIVEVDNQGEILMIGALVDAVKAVIKIDENNLEAPPKVGMAVDTAMIEALGKYDDDFVIVLNTDRLFSIKELSVVRESLTDEEEKNSEEETPEELQTPEEAEAGVI